MKSIFLTLSLALIATFSYAQFPQKKTPDTCCYVAPELRVAIFTDNNAIVNVKVAKNPGDKVKIKVLENNKVLYQKIYKSWALVDVKYDISQFPKGQYTFEIVQDKEVVFSQIIHVNASGDKLAQR
ncbi:MAG: hypothetical protein Q8O72_00500 [Bacteroidales bacterium]|nr:hypothetical protein [Bacteroidales bacterium]